MKFIITIGLIMATGAAWSQGSRDTAAKLPDKIYAFTGKVLYENAESLRITFFVLGENRGKYTETRRSSIIYFDMINGKDEVLYKDKLHVVDGVAYTHIPLRNLPGGQYRIRAITSWNLNFMEIKDCVRKLFYVQTVEYTDMIMQYSITKDLYFPKDTVKFQFSIKNEDLRPVNNATPTFSVISDGKVIAQSIPQDVKLSGDNYEVRMVLPDSIHSNDGVIAAEFFYNNNTYSKVYPIFFNSLIGDISFLPEGGAMMPEVSCNVAFRCISRFGTGLDVKGVILNEREEVVQLFESSHKGMGKFAFIPKEGEKYHARILEPAWDSLVMIPSADKFKQFHMEIVQRNDSFIAKINSLTNTNITIRITQDNQHESQKTIYVRNGENLIPLSLNGLAPGICRITLVHLFMTQCERLVFNKPNGYLKLNLLSNRELQAGKTNSVLLKVTDENGRAVRTKVAVSIVNELNHNMANDRQGSLFASMLLSDELKGNVEDPNWYFADITEEKMQKLDLVMLVHGWRKKTYTPTTRQLERTFVVLPVDYGKPVADVSGNPFGGPVFSSAWSHRSYHIPFTTASIRTSVGLQNPWASIFVSEHPLLFGAFLHRGFSTMAKKEDDRLSNKASQSKKMEKTEEQPVENENPIASRDDGSEKAERIIDAVSVKVRPRNDLINLCGSSTSISGSYLLGSGVRGIGGLIATNSAIYNTPLGMSVRGSRTDGNAMYIDGQRVIGGSAIGDLVDISGPLTGWLYNPVAYPGGNNSSVAYGIGGSVKMPVVGESLINLGRSSLQPGGLGTLATFAISVDAAPAFPGRDFGYSYPYRYSNYYYSSYSYYYGRYNHELWANLPSNFKGENEGYQYYEPKCYIEIYAQDRNPVSVLQFIPVLNSDSAGNLRFDVKTNMNEAAYRLVVDGFGAGNLISDTLMLFVKPYLGISWEIPDYITSGDVFYHQIKLNNNTDSNLSIKYKIVSGSITESSDLLLQPNSSNTFMIKEMNSNIVNYKLLFEYGEFTEIFQKKIRILPRSYNNEIIIDAANVSGNYEFYNPGNVNEIVLTKVATGSDNIISTAEKMIRQPYGCFEQVSSSNYPNLLVYLLLKNTSQLTVESREKLEGYIKQGLASLQKYKTTQGGYEWFGNTPPHQALTAYGLIQFDLAAQLNFMDKSVPEETKKWLLGQALSSGGFINNAGKYDHFSNIPDVVSDAYITYALARVKAEGIEKHIAKVEQDLKNNFDIYRAALLLNIYAFRNDSAKSQVLLKKMESFMHNSKDLSGMNMRTITNSTGNSAAVETLSLYGQALCIMNKPDQNKITEILNNVYALKTKCGDYQTQANALFVEFAARCSELTSGRSDSVKTDLVTFNNRDISLLNPGLSLQHIRISNSFLIPGKNVVNMYLDSKKFIYSMRVSFHSNSFYYHDTGFYAIKTTWMSDSVEAGGINVMHVKISNELHTERGQTIATLFFPSGAQPGPEVLSALKKQHYFDHYEIDNNKLILYFLKFKAGEVREFDIAVNCLYAGNFYISEPRVFAFYEDKNLNTGSPFMLRVKPAKLNN